MKLYVMFDTNSIITNTPTELLSSNATKTIEDCRKHDDISISWYIPDIVVMERKYQMKQKVSELMPNVYKIEKLLGIDLKMTEEKIELQMNTLISETLKRYNLIKADINTEIVDWKNVINNSVARLPPFKIGKHEAGFRDMLILETFLQLLKDSPGSPQSCKLILVTNDGPLKDATTIRTEKNKKVIVVESIDKLKEYISTISSKISQEILIKAQAIAREYISKAKEIKNIFYLPALMGQIQNHFSQQLNEPYDGSYIRSNDILKIGTTRFVAKNKQRYTWNTTVVIPCTSTSLLYSSPVGVNVIGEVQGVHLKSGTYGLLESDSTSQPRAVAGIRPLQPLGVGSIGSIGVNYPVLWQSEIKNSFEGESVFEVEWSHLLKTNNKLYAAKIEKIEFIETKWNV